MDEIWLMRCSFSSKDEALTVARALLEEKLAACANISDPITALYHWEDMMQQENETVALFKTSAAKVETAMARIKSLHSYQIPSIVAWKIDAANASFAHWIANELGSANKFY